MENVKRDAPGNTRISGKHQITIPVSALREAGLHPGDRLAVRAEGPGRVVLEREDDDDFIRTYAGMLTGAFEPGYLERLRDEWD